MKVALVHDWLTGMRGGERCLEAFIDMYPDADIAALFHVPGSVSNKIESRVKQCSFLNKLPAIEKCYRYLLPLFPAAARSLDLRGYDLVVSLSHAAAKNIKVPHGVPHICYCFTPMRYIWDQAWNYFGALALPLTPTLRLLRRWDIAGSERVTGILGISRFISARIRRFYGRNAAVLYPPVETGWITPRAEGEPGEAFLYAGALVPYKRVDIVIETFNRLGEQLWIVGDGPERKRLERMARPNVTFFGQVSDQELASFYRRSRALIFPGREDFGLVPVEAMAAGRPVIAGFHGAVRESICGLFPWQREERFESGTVTGIFVRPREGIVPVEELLAGVRYFIEHEGEFLARACVKQSQLFSPQNFQAGWEAVLRAGGLDGALPYKDRDARMEAAC